MKSDGLTPIEQNITDNINRLFKLTGKDRNDLAELLGVSYASVTRYCLGVNTPKIDSLVKICEFFNVSMYDLLGISDETTPVSFTQEEIKIIDSYRAKNGDIKDIVKKILDVK